VLLAYPPLSVGVSVDRDKVSTPARARYRFFAKNTCGLFLDGRLPSFRED